MTGYKARSCQIRAGAADEATIRPRSSPRIPSAIAMATATGRVRGRFLERASCECHAWRALATVARSGLVLTVVHHFKGEICQISEALQTLGILHRPLTPAPGSRVVQVGRRAPYLGGVDSGVGGRRSRRARWLAADDDLLLRGPGSRRRQSRGPDEQPFGASAPPALSSCRVRGRRRLRRQTPLRWRRCPASTTPSSCST
jgi:hypothetical protein